MLFIFMFIATILEMVGLGFIFSIVGSMGSIEINNIFVNKFGALLSLNKSEILLYLLAFFLFFYVFKIIFLIFYNWFESNFLYTYKEFLSSNVFSKYLEQSVNYFYNRNSSEFIRNLITEVDQFTSYLNAFLKLAIELIVVAGIFCLLAYVNLKFTIFISVIFLSISCLYFFLVKEKLNSWGIQRQLNIQKRIQFMQEGFDGIKIIKLLGRENFFFNKFKIHNIIKSIYESSFFSRYT